MTEQLTKLKELLGVDELYCEHGWKFRCEPCKDAILSMLRKLEAERDHYRQQAVALKQALERIVSLDPWQKFEDYAVKANEIANDGLDAAKAGQ